MFEAGSGEGQHAVFATDVGSNVYRLLATNARDPALSADGKTVAFVRHSGAYRLNADLVTMPFSGGQETVIRQMSLSDGWAEVDIDNPSFSPSGDEIAYGCRAVAYDRPAAKRTIGSPICSPLERVITTSAGNAGSITAPYGANNPEFLTDPNQVVYESGSSPDGSASEDNHVHIWSSAADPSEIERLTPLNGFDVVAGPASSPDGTQIAVHAFNYPEGGGAVTAQLHLLDPLSHTLEPIVGAY